MSIFTRIKDAIFGSRPAATAPRTQAVPPRRSSQIPASQIPASPANAKWDAPVVDHVDVDQVLQGLAERHGLKLNWKTSIVDLMKLLDIDSSLENRKDLARELGYTGDTSDSARMNIWLHKRVMQELEKNGGKVSAALVA